MTERYTLHQNGNYHTVIDEEKNVPLIMIEFKENEFPVYACFHRIIDSLNEKDKRIKRLEKKEQDKEKDNVMWALDQFRYKEKTEDERKAFCIIESILNTKW